MFESFLRQSELLYPEGTCARSTQQSLMPPQLTARLLRATPLHRSAAGTIKWRAENDVDSYLTRFLPGDGEAVVRRCKQDGNLGTDKKVGTGAG